MAQKSGSQKLSSIGVLQNTSSQLDCRGLAIYYRLLFNIMPRNDQSTSESLKNVLVEGLHKSEHLLITVFWRERVLAWAGNLCVYSLSESERFVTVS